MSGQLYTLSGRCSFHPPSRRGGPRWRRIRPAHASGGLFPLVSKPNSSEEIGLVYPRHIPLNIPRLQSGRSRWSGSAIWWSRISYFGRVAKWVWIRLGKWRDWSKIRRVVFMLSFIVGVTLVMWPLMLALSCLAWESPIGQGVPHEVHEMHEWYTGFSSVLDPGCGWF